MRHFLQYQYFNMNLFYVQEENLRMRTGLISSILN